MAPPNPTADELRGLTIAEVSDILGTSQQSVRKLIHIGRLPAKRIGEVLVRVLRRDLEAFLDANPVTGPAPGRGPSPRRRKRARSSGR